MKSAMMWFASIDSGKLKSIAGGRMPRYFQVPFSVKFKDDVPTEITYVLSRELH
jgi:hypothetical protein